MARGWYVSPALVQLNKQINAAASTRRKGNDGTIGDAAHAARDSDHNPLPSGEVTANDWTHDPPRFDAHKMARELVAKRDPRLKMAISLDEIWTAARSAEGWRPYNRGNPRRNKHIGHAHVSVWPDSSAAAWDVPMLGGTPSTSKDLDMNEDRLRAIVRDEVTRGSNRTIEFLAKMVADNATTGFNKMAEWTKAMSDLTVSQLKQR